VSVPSPNCSELSRRPRERPSTLMGRAERRELRGRRLPHGLVLAGGQLAHEAQQARRAGGMAARSGRGRRRLHVRQARRVPVAARDAQDGFQAVQAARLLRLGLRSITRSGHGSAGWNSTSRFGCTGSPAPVGQAKLQQGRPPPPSQPRHGRHKAHRRRRTSKLLTQVVTSGNPAARVSLCQAKPGLAIQLPQEVGGTAGLCVTWRVGEGQQTSPDQDLGLPGTVFSGWRSRWQLKFASEASS